MFLIANIAKVLKKIEELRSSVTEDKESLDKWQEVLKRSDDDIVTFNNFAKEDNSTVNVTTFNITTYYVFIYMK